MKSEAKNHPNVLPELDPIFQVLDFGEGAITLRLLFWLKINLQRLVQRATSEEVLREDSTKKALKSPALPDISYNQGKAAFHR